MNERLNYISDIELEQLILQVEQEELVAAPPDLMENILQAAGLGEEPVQKASQTTTIVPVESIVAKKKEFYAYCFRVIASVAAAIALVFLLPELSARMQRTEQATEQYKQEVPSLEEVVEAVPSRDEVVLAMRTPTKDEVLNDTGLIERVLSNTNWFNKKNNDK